MEDQPENTGPDLGKSQKVENGGPENGPAF